MLKVYVLFSSDDILFATVKPWTFHLLMPVFFTVYLWFTWLNVHVICVKFLNFVIIYERIPFEIVPNSLAPELIVNWTISLKKKHRLQEKKARNFDLHKFA